MSRLPETPCPWVSVIMPTFNGEAYLHEALQSLVKQTDRSFELIVVDDGSTDATVNIVKAYADRLPLTLVTPPRRGNWVSVTNLALQRAACDHISFLHQDDTWFPDRLARLKMKAERQPEALLFFHPVCFMDAAGRPAGIWRPPFRANRGRIPSAEMLSKLAVQNFISVSSACFKKQAALRAGGLDEALWYTADWQLWLTLSSLGDTVCCPEILGRFRLHNASLTAAGSADPVEFADQMHRVADASVPLLRRSGVDIHETRRLADFSIAVNCALSAAARRKAFNLKALLFKLAAIGPAGFFTYLTYSRIVERSLARIRAGIALKTTDRKNG